MNYTDTATRSDEWYTPLPLIKSLGKFDLDPCAAPCRLLPNVKNHYTKEDNGLRLPWKGRVWLNPPYSRDIIKYFMRKMSKHNNGIAFIFARTDTKFYQRWVLETCASILFIKGRIKFFNYEGEAAYNAGAPSCLVAYGENNVEALEYSGIEGKHVLVNYSQLVVVGVSPSWKSVVTIAMSRIKTGNVAAVYEMVEMVAPDKVTSNKHYKEKIRQTLQRHFNKKERGVYNINL